MSDDLKAQLREKLLEMFRPEHEDLEFGIYRLLNQKRREIERFIEKDLIEEVSKELGRLGEQEQERIIQELEEIKIKIRNELGESAFENGDLRPEFRNTPLGKKYYEKKKQLEKTQLSADLEREIYNHIITFFSRYYENGDFINQRRYGKKDKYVIPYKGEEVLLHWATKDQYYIKTTEYFKKYSFREEGIIINFRVIEAQQEKGNIKEQEKKYFVLSQKKPEYDKQKRELDIYFEYRALTDEEKEKYKTGNTVKQENINKEAVETLKQELGKRFGFLFETVDTQKEDYKKHLIGKHVYAYTKRNTSDYFIHKDLKGFLERELDFYIKNEVLTLDNLQILEKDTYYDTLRLRLVAAKTFRNIAQKIIEFLAQIENFQKKLWEKKKFVLSTHYVITLDKIKQYAGEQFLESIIDEILANKKQIEEWNELYGIKAKTKKDLLEPQEKINGRQWKKLPVDTKHFDEDFKWKLLAALTQNNTLDEILDGILIKSENWQALNLLLNKYREKVKCVYIDPPYNTGNDDFLYKDRYQHSSWLTMIENRLRLTRDLMSKDGVLFVSIDDNEHANLWKLTEAGFGLQNMITSMVWEGGLKNDSRFISVSHDYILTSVKDKEYLIQKNEKWRVRKEGIDEIYSKLDELKKKYGQNYEIISQKLKEWYSQLPKNHPARAHRHYNMVDEKGVFFPGDISWPGGGGPIYDVLHPVTHKPVAKPSRGWVFSKPERMHEAIKEGRVLFGPDETYVPKLKRYLHETEGQVIPSVFYRDRRAAFQQLRDILGEDRFQNPKDSLILVKLFEATSENSSLVLDFFAGSGTTAHAVMKLNKDDGGRRKFILVEMADYFDTVIIPRIKKVAYSFNWRDGRPLDGDGIGVFFKYQVLEQYEDALENIEFGGEQRQLSSFSEYFLRYMLEWETRESRTFLNLDAMRDPFGYKLHVIENYQPRDVVVDLVETFNYLIGLSVKRVLAEEANGRRYVFVLGEKDGRNTLVVWRSMEDIDFEEDKKIIEEKKREMGTDEVYVNGDCVVEGFKPIEPEFKSLMFERVE